MAISFVELIKVPNLNYLWVGLWIALEEGQHKWVP